MEFRQASKISKKAPTFDCEIIGQSCRDDRCLLDFDSIWSTVDNCITTSERVNIGRNAQLPGTKLEIPSLVIAIRARGIDDKANRWIKLRGKGFIRSSERRPNIAHDFFFDFALEFLLTGSGSTHGRR